MSLMTASTSKVLATQRLFFSTINSEFGNESITALKAPLSNDSKTFKISDDNFRKISKFFLRLKNDLMFSD